MDLTNYDYEIIDTTPCDEPCCPITDRAKSMKEARAFIGQLMRTFKTDGLVFKTVWCPHDFGSYPQIYVYYTESSEETMLNVVNNLPEKWDSEAKEELQ